MILRSLSVAGSLIPMIATAAVVLDFAGSSLRLSTQGIL